VGVVEPEVLSLEALQVNHPWPVVSSGASAPLTAHWFGQSLTCYPVRIGSKIIGPIIAIIALFSPFIAPFFTSPNLLPIHAFQ
jgi:hypothetical protein